MESKLESGIFFSVIMVVLVIAFFGLTSMIRSCKIKEDIEMELYQEIIQYKLDSVRALRDSLNSNTSQIRHEN